jgi:glyoxylase-like metal-dependent hydrolase (beta-lactamase superfamily II)
VGKYQLKNLKGNTWIIEAPANIGLYTEDNITTIIDSGNDKEAGKQILNLIKGQNWVLKYIVNTHSNADHIGGNAYLQSNANCRICATKIEAAIIQDPVLEPTFLWGTLPLKELRNKFLEAKPSSVTDIIDNEGRIADTQLEAIALKGHFIDMIGVRTPDNVIFLGDSIFSKEIIEKYPVFFLYDVQEYLNTLDKIGALQADLFVPSHGRVSEDLTELIEINKSNVSNISETIINICSEPLNMEAVLQKLCGHYNIKLNCSQYVLVGSTLKSYLTYLQEKGLLEYYFESEKMLWRRKL